MTPLELYQRMLDHYGPQHWWPADSPFEMALGAFLTQNTAWTNVEKAIDQLRAEEVLTVEGVLSLSDEELQGLIRSSGFFRQKSGRIKAFVTYLQVNHEGRLKNLLAQPMDQVRSELLALKGVGPETADSILLYAGEHLSFVVDAYTRRLGTRVGLLQGDESYETIRGFFMEQLPQQVPVYNEYHALIVAHCKAFCRVKPRCETCFLRHDCKAADNYL